MFFIFSRILIAALADLLKVIKFLYFSFFITFCLHLFLFLIVFLWSTFIPFRPCEKNGFEWVWVHEALWACVCMGRRSSRSLIHFSDMTWASNHWQLNCLFNSSFQPTMENIKAPHYWPFVRGIHQWLVDSPHKGPVMWKAFPYHDVIMSSTHPYSFI